MVGSDRRKWFALALILAVQFMVILDVAIVNVALPSIQIDLGFSQENLRWSASAYARLPALPPTRWPLRRPPRPSPRVHRRHRRLHDRFAALRIRVERRSLIAFRAFQGLGAAMITPDALSILVATFAEGRRLASRWEPGALSAASAPRPASCSAESSPTTCPGSGSSGSTSRSE